MQINQANADKARETLRRSFNHIRDRIATRDYLVDNRFTRADLAVVSLIAPCWREIPDFPPALQDFVNDLHDHEGMLWAKEIYAQHRSR